MKDQGPTCPVIPPCSLEDLEPLLDHLRSNAAVREALRFPRGTLLPDGRLDLCKQGLGSLGTQAVARALTGHEHVSSLLLGANALGDDGARAVAELLPANESLTTLFLGCNGITAEGGGALARRLGDRPNLRGLWLKRNPLGEEGLKHLAGALAEHPSLRTLDLIDTEARGKGLEALVEVLVHRNRGVRRLFLGANQLGSGDAAALGRLLRAAGPLRELYVENNPLGDEGVALLAEALVESRLEVLDLGSTGLGERGLCELARALAANPALRRLEVGQARSAAIYAAPRNTATPHAAAALLKALEPNESLRRLGMGRGFPRRRELGRLLAARRNAGEPSSVPEDVLAVRSVYRALPKRRKSHSNSDSGEPRSEVRAAEPPRPDLEISDEELQACVRTLERLRRKPDLFDSEKERFAPLRASANRLIHAIVEEVRREKQKRPRPARDPAQSRERNRRRDRALADRTGIRRQRARAVPEGRTDAVAREPSGRETSLARPRRCHVCREPYGTLHVFYDTLCPACAELNFAKREQSADLSGRTALLTGGRIKIGYQIALKLLRAGATLIVTTRFPCSAARRFASCDDFETWRERLRIVGVDFRHLLAVEQLGRTLSRELAHLDVLILNAAQTVRRPPAFYAPLLGAEQAGVAALEAPVAALVDVESSMPDAAQLTQRALLPEDLAQPSLLFPTGRFQEDGQQLDLRPTNSWTLPLPEVSTLELLEVHAVNTLTPFILLRELEGLLAGSRRPEVPAAYVVAVSAMEGSFSRPYKSETHPHTNMAKAALNMLTRTCAESLAEKGVYVNSVDTGWVTDEQPHPVRQGIRRRQGFEPPLDEVDGAARVLDPLFSDLRRGGLFLKNYRSVDW